MKTIFKTVLEIADQQRVMLPSDAEILCAKEQRGHVCIWYICSDTIKSVRFIYIVGTGHPMPNGNMKYLGTASLAEGDLIIHVFEGS